MVRSARRRRLLGIGVLAAVVLLVGACAREAPQDALAPAGPYARLADDLWNLVFGLAVVVFVLVQGALIFAIVRFRERKGDDGSLPVQVHGNPMLEALWTVIPAALLAFIAVPTIQGIFALAQEPEDAMRIEVVGHMWWWEFIYERDGERIHTANELHIPAGQPVLLSLGSRDVLHSFWLPRLAGKQDAVPGRTRTLLIEADEPGRYVGQCAEYCGLSHANMRIVAVAQTPADFEAWLTDQARPALQPGEGTLEARGHDLFMGAGACAQCHAISGTPAQARTGPDLTHFASRSTFAGAIFELTDENVRAWLENPPARKPMQPDIGRGMPDLGLTPDEVEALTAYLLSLR